MICSHALFCKLLPGELTLQTASEKNNQKEWVFCATYSDRSIPNFAVE
jgi:hypothetical protein